MSDSLTILYVKRKLIIDDIKSAASTGNVGSAVASEIIDLAKSLEEVQENILKKEEEIRSQM